jgi:glycosyltransferase involved in cell wall biosynthesis
MIVVNMMLSKGRGGIESAFVNYCRCLLLYGHEVHAIIAPVAAIDAELRGLPQVHIHYLNNCGQWDVFAKWKLKKMVEVIQPTVLFAHANRAMSLSRWLQKKVRVIPVVHNYSIKRALQFQQIVTTTQHLKKTLQAQATHEQSVFVLPNMLPLPSYMPRVITSPLVIGALGRFVAKKGFDVWLRALARLRDRHVEFHAILAGAGEEEASLRALASELELTDKVCFTGWIQPEDFFSRIDIFCLPSLHEPFGIVLIEAFAYEKPVVTTLTEGPSEIAEDQKNALIVQPGDPHALAEQLELLLQREVLRCALAKQAKQTFLERYALETVAAQLEMLLQEQVHTHYR